MKVAWVKCTGSVWCQLSTVNMASISGKGVYLIWHVPGDGDRNPALYVGQGDIQERVSYHKTNPELDPWRPEGAIYVTWTMLPNKADRNGVERYLADRFNPLVGSHHPDVLPIEVNVPGA